MIKLVVSSAVALASVAAAQDGAERPPNIVYIMADDLGYGDLGCYGQTRIRTPHIDRLAAEGMRFTDHYSGHTVCRPSRLVLWTGMHSGHTAISSNTGYFLRPEDVTVAQRLRSAGYATGGVGKWANGNVENTGHPNDQGFDLWVGYLDQGIAHNYYPTHLWRNRERFRLEGNELSDHKRARGRYSKKRVTYSHDVMTDAAFEFVRESAERPFLLHVHWTIPHANNEGGAVSGNGSEVPELGEYAARDWPEPEKGFAAMVTRMDRDVGRLLDLLAELEIDEHTLVLFTSDNGPHNEGRHKHTFFDSNGPLRGFKRDLYEGGIRVPMIARWPGKVQAGSVTDHPSAAWDFVPTACELAGLDAPKDIDGISYAPTLFGREQPQHECLFWEFDRGKGREKLALRQGKWKLVKPGGKKPWELYDLSSDIGETRDLASERAELVARLRTLAASCR